MADHAKIITIRTANPGDRIVEGTQTIEEKSKQLAVDAPDITGDHIQVPAYFIVKYPDGEIKALHHVRDAKEISDVIRQTRFDEEDEEDGKHQSAELGALSHLWGFVLLFVLALSMMTVVMLTGIF